MGGIYRKSALEKLSSPDQLDELITIIHPSFWIAAVGGLTILLAVSAWSVFGRIPVKTGATGIYLGRDGIYTVYSGSAGIVEEVFISEGDTVKNGDVIARLRTAEYEEKLKDIGERMSRVENVTPDSTGDIAIAENRELLDIKSRLKAASASGEAYGEEGYKVLEDQFETAKDSMLDELNRQRKEYANEIDRASIRSSSDGYVLSLGLEKGKAVYEGMPVCFLALGEADDKNDDAVILYMPAETGKSISPGMEVMVYPSTVNSQEYGHMVAYTTEVSEYMVSEENMKSQLGEDTLVQSFMKQGPVIAVTCELQTDPNTASGYKWSGKKGAEVVLKAGTIVTADVVTERKAPITMVIHGKG